MPAEADAGRLASCCAIRASRPPLRAQPPSRRWRSVGTSAIDSPMASAMPANTAGTTVRPNGASPGNIPIRRPSPQMISAATYGK